MLSILPLWTAVGLLVAGGEALDGPVGQAPNPQIDRHSPWDSSPDPERIILSSTSAAWHRDVNVDSSTHALEQTVSTSPSTVWKGSSTIPASSSETVSTATGTCPPVSVSFVTVKETFSTTLWNTTTATAYKTTTSTKIATSHVPTPSPTTDTTYVPTPSPTTETSYAPTPSPTTDTTYVPTPSLTTDTSYVPTPTPTTETSYVPTPTPTTETSYVPTPSPTTATDTTYVPTPSPTTETDTSSVPTTIISPTTAISIVPTTITKAPNPCPTTCTASAGTVNLFYWPTDGHSYPTTYVNSHLDYTFTSPSVYMVVDTLAGYNTAGRAGPSGTSVVFALDLTEVSTIQGSATQQLTLGDLGTDCPKSENPSFIATAPPDGRCRPVLAAPPAVKSWVSPCNGCGNFGLFDPPYAVPTLEGGLVPAPETTSTSEPETTSTSEPETTSTLEPETKTVPTAAPTTSSSPAEETTSSPSSASSSTEEATSPDQPAPPTTSNAAPTTSSGTSSTTASDPSSASGSSSSASAPAFTGSAVREIPGLAWLVMSFFASACLI